MEITSISCECFRKRLLDGNAEIRMIDDKENELQLAERWDDVDASTKKIRQKKKKTGKREIIDFM